VFYALLYVVLGTGLQWSNIDTLSNFDDNFTMLDTLKILALDIVLFSLIAWYFDALFPGDFGTSQPFYFPFTVMFFHSDFDLVKVPVKCTQLKT